MIDRDRLATLRTDEESRFVDLHPRSAALAAEARGPLLAGVPMPWMTRWAGSFPVTFDTATGARLVDVDGAEYVDLCLGDTGAMTGHALPQVADAVAERARAGLTTMLPSTDATWCADELARRFGVPQWQFAISATDANRFVLRFARHLTGRPRVAVMDWCYHGTVDESFAVLDAGKVVPRPGSMGPQVDPAITTAVLPFNEGHFNKDCIIAVCYRLNDCIANAFIVETFSDRLVIRPLFESRGNHCSAAKINTEIERLPAGRLAKNCGSQTCQHQQHR